MSALVFVQFGLSLLAGLLGAAAGWWLRGRPEQRVASRPAPSRKQVAADVLQSLQAAAETVRSCVEQHAECIRTIQSELGESTSTEAAIITNAAESIVASNELAQHQFADIRHAIDDQRREIRSQLVNTDGWLFTIAALDRQKHMYGQVLSSLEVLAAELTRDITGHGQRLQKITGELENSGSQTTAGIASAVTQILDATDEVQRRVAAKEQRIATHATTVDMQAILTHADLLTSLPNRRAMEDELRRSAAQANSRTPYCTLLFVDLDEFSRVNNSYGHQGGDLVLRKAAGVLKEAVSGRDMVARFGGDTFAILLNRTTVHDALPVAERVRKVLEGAEFSHGSRPLRVTASVGIAQLTLDEMNEADISRVDEALHAAHRAGGNVCYRHDGKACHPLSSVFQSREQQATEPSLSLAALWRDSATAEQGGRAEAECDESAAIDDRAPNLSGRSLFAANLGRRLGEWKRGGSSVSVAVLRIDQMAELIDRFGDQGHDFLRQVLSRLLEATTREMDERCEFEDGLFALLLPGTDKGDALAVAERLCGQVRQCKVRMGRDLWELTSSIGVAHCTVAARVMDIMLSAEAAMELASTRGGDAVCVGEPVPEPLSAAAIR